VTELELHIGSTQFQYLDWKQLAASIVTSPGFPGASKSIPGLQAYRLDQDLFPLLFSSIVADITIRSAKNMLISLSVRVCPLAF